MMQVAAKLKEFLEDNDVFISFNNITEKIELSPATGPNGDYYDVPEDLWGSDT